ncbi:MAG: uroporphyrinogen-III synthase [Cellulomonas sp.]|nr:uroporphyrinogen-III synthase [Cellulomonas sp.]
MSLVAGVDSSTQSCKVVVRDAATGALVRSGRAAHPDGTEVDPQAWWAALQVAIDQAGGLDDVEALAVGGQQHGMVALDASGEVVRDALLWNDTRSAPAARELIDELGGPQAWASAIGSVPVASLTVTKLRWLRDAEPANAARVAAVALPHDWLTWRLAGGFGELGFEGLATDRSDVSGTGYWSPFDEAYRLDLLERALGSAPALPRVLGPHDVAGRTAAGVPLGPGAGDNAAAALALGLGPGDVSVSIGTSGVVAAVADSPTADGSGLVTGFADATGRYLPLACTLNASRILDWACRLLGVDYDELSRLALSAPSGADGLDEAFTAAGAHVQSLVVYRWGPPPDPAALDASVRAAAAGELDTVVFTSAPGCAAWLAAADAAGVDAALRGQFEAGALVAAAVGPITARPLLDRGVEPLVPSRGRLGALVRTIVDHYGGVQTLETAAGRLQMRRRAAVLDGRVLALSPTGIELLRLFADAGGDVVTPAQVLQSLPGESTDVHAAEVAIARLRQATGSRELVRTVVKRGYRLAVVDGQEDR